MLTPLPISSGRVPLPVVPADAEAFILTLAEALHAYGASAHRLEGMLTLVARRLGIEARFYSTPTAVMASFGAPAAERTSLLRVEPGGIDLEKLSLLQEAVVRVTRGELDLERGRAEVSAILRARPRYGALATVLAFGLSSAAAAVFLGGGVREIAAAFAAGLAVGATARVSARGPRGSSLVEPLGGVVASVGAGLLAALTPGLSTVIVTLAGVITLLPGLGITTAMTELATRNLASGTARFAGAAVQLLGVAFGVGLGSRVMSWLPQAPAAPPVAWHPIAPALAVVVAGCAFTVLLSARPRDAGWIVVAAGIAFAGARAGAHLFGPELGAFVGALLVGLTGNVFAQVFDRPSAVLQVPGLLVLVPGSVGFRGLVSMLESDVLHGVDAAFKMVLVAISLVAGMLVAQIALPPRRAL
jgi:uncharacterized membrane protein YjjP (DUF1212 family)